MTAQIRLTSRLTVRWTRRVLSTAVPAAVVLSAAAGPGPGASVDAGPHPGLPGAHSTGTPSAATPAGTVATGHPTGRTWTWPLRPRPQVVHLFSAPASPYGPGHRGVDLATRPGGLVRAVDAGTVTHVGPVAGRGTVTVAHASGLRSTYEPVRSRLEVGDTVDAGQVIGTVESGQAHCGATACLHLGALAGRTYLDPLSLLGAGGVVLLPVDAARGQCPCP
jgi:murein DD-endopeptidase MepM/ murein hydrolase activator NlpD